MNPFCYLSFFILYYLIHYFIYDSFFLFLKIHDNGNAIFQNYFKKVDNFHRNRIHDRNLNWNGYSHDNYQQRMEENCQRIVFDSDAFVFEFHCLPILEWDRSYHHHHRVNIWKDITIPLLFDLEVYFHPFVFLSLLKSIEEFFVIFSCNFLNQTKFWIICFFFIFFLFFILIISKVFIVTIFKFFSGI